MRLRQFTFVLGLTLLATFTLKAQNGQSGYWAPTGQTQEKLYVNSGEGDTNNLTIIDVKTMKIIKKMTTGKHPHGVASPKSQDVLYIASETEGTVTRLLKCTAVGAPNRRNPISLQTAVFCISRRTRATGMCSIRRRRRLSPTFTRWASDTTR
jgi:hypothetical protein